MIPAYLSRSHFEVAASIFVVADTISEGDFLAIETSDIFFYYPKVLKADGDRLLVTSDDQVFYLRPWQEGDELPFLPLDTASKWTVETIEASLQIDA